MELQVIGTKRLVGVQKDSTAQALRIELSDDGKAGVAWLLTKDQTPIGIEKSWDDAAAHLRGLGYKVRAEELT